VKCSTLLLYGAKDERVSREETDEIFNNIAGEKKLVILPDSGHQNYFKTNEKEWISAVNEFLNKKIN
jgi:alpha-beta hydrolase superfamily lysophospholipase